MSGGDLPEMPIPLDSQGHAGDCDALCANRAACGAYSFTDCGPKRCWLKYEAQPMRPDVCRVSMMASY